jgi:arylesterase / paraoxonase
MKLLLKIAFFIALIVIIFVARLLINAGVFTKIKPHFNGKISEINGFESAEDITIDQETGIAFISSSDFFTKTSKKGAIFTLILNEKDPKPINVTSKLPFDFHPHGICLYKSRSGKKSLFVVNHRADGHFIEIFDWNDTTLTHRESISNPLIISPNDVLAVGERSFYVTNDHDEPLSKIRANKDLLQIPMGNICFYNGKNAKILVDKILYANGINISNNKKTIFVAATTGKKIKVFDRNTESNAITETDEIPIHGADNIEIDTQDNIWVGCHINLLAFLEHSKDQTKLSPSEVIKINYSGKGNYQLESIYQNDGKSLSGSSVGAFYQNKILIGAVFENKVLLGEMK